MKKKNVIISTLLTFSLLLVPLTIHFDKLGTNNNSPTLLFSKTTSEAAFLPWLKKLVWPIAKAAVGGVTEYFYNVEASVTSGTYEDTITPGSISFNDGTYGASTYFDFKIPSTGHSVNIYADSTIWRLFTGKISVLLENPYGNYVINRSVNPTQWSTYSPGITGDYRALWVQNDKQKWTPYIGYRQDNGYASAEGIISLTTVAASDQEKENINNHLITVKNYGNIISPSKAHLNSKINRDINDTLTAEEIDQQFLDLSLGVHVYALKDFEIGDTVNFKDIVKNIEYDDEENRTVFTFKGTEEDYDIVFSDDLTDEFKTNQVLRLKFNVNQLVSGNNKLAMIDYLKYGLDNNNEAPRINKYLVE